MSGDPKYPISTAVVNWFDTAGQLHIRVYSCDGYEVIERCNDGNGWVTGQFKAPGSHVSATAWMAGNGANIRVYCTSDDVTTEWVCDPANTSWTQGTCTTT